MLGLLTLDTAFPRIPGDIGAPETFAFPVRIATIAGATPNEIVHRRQDALLPKFIAAADDLAVAGCLGITTTCGFLVRWQRELTKAIRVPVLTSALLQIPLLAQTVPFGRRVGVVTYSAAELTPSVLAAAGADPHTPVEGVDPDGYFSRLIRNGGATLDRARMAQDVIEAARRVLAAHRDIGALVLECANMPPYRDAVAAEVGLPVFDAAQLVAWFYSGLPGASPRYAHTDLW